ncbi:MAG: serine hydrolase [Gammaproteobacteria bacterium]|nr:serine hydrolase [Gammaproteobacteria bacterium]
MLKHISITLFLLQIPIPIAAAAQDGSLSASVDTLFVQMDLPDRPGAAVLVIKDGVVLHRKGYGSANIEHQIPITPKSVFDIASVSKQFTGMAISMLVEKGIVNLDDDIRNYIPDVPEFSNQITVRHLIHHMSGVRDWPATLAIAGWQMDDVISFDQILTMAYNQRALNFEPGERHLYSNTGYNLLAELVSRATGKTFREWTRENLFVPLGMNDTHFQDDHTELTPTKVYGYRGKDDSYSAVANGLTALGSSSLFTTIDDLGKWVTNFDDHTVGGTSVIERMRTRGTLNNGATIAYAYGLSIGEYRGQQTISHGGSWAGFRTTLLHFPDQRFGIVILGNLESFNPSRWAYQIADLYLADVLTTIEENDDDELGPKDAVPVDVATLDGYVGTYKLGPGWFVEITSDGDHLLTQATRELRFPMVAISQDEFYVPAYKAGMTFRRNGNRQVTHFDYRGIKAKRMEAGAWNPSSEELRALEGEYFSEELATSYSVELRGEALVAKHRRHQAIELRPLVHNEFGGSLWFASGVEFVRDNSGNITAMLISNGRSLNNEFTRVYH